MLLRSSNYFGRFINSNSVRAADSPSWSVKPSCSIVPDTCPRNGGVKCWCPAALATWQSLPEPLPWGVVMAVNTAELLKPEYYLPAPLSSLETHSIHPMWVDYPWTTSLKKKISIAKYFSSSIAGPVNLLTWPYSLLQHGPVNLSTVVSPNQSQVLGSYVYTVFLSLSTWTMVRAGSLSPPWFHVFTYKSCPSNTFWKVTWKIKVTPFLTLWLWVKVSDFKVSH